MLPKVKVDSKVRCNTSQPVRSADSYPAAAGITYNTVVSVVGVADLDNLLIAVAGTDGSYVS